MHKAKVQLLCNVTNTHQCFRASDFHSKAHQSVPVHTRILMKKSVKDKVQRIQFAGFTILLRSMFALRCFHQILNQKQSTSNETMYDLLYAFPNFVHNSVAKLSPQRYNSWQYSSTWRSQNVKYHFKWIHDENGRKWKKRLWNEKMTSREIKIAGNEKNLRSSLISNFHTSYQIQNNPHVFMTIEWRSQQYSCSH